MKGYQKINQKIHNFTFLQLRDLRSLFVKFDSDGNGELDVDEMKQLIDQLKIVATTDDLKVLYKLYYDH